VGQQAACSVLLRSLSERRFAHAYLFSGPRGCGKTTAARLVAKALDCERGAPGGEPCCECAACRAVAAGECLDVVEIDGASNRGIDEIRELKSQVALAPFSAPYKVYIVDEVHMLTEAAFNALLKTLEEPPASVVFVLATTEAHKVPVTIRSRCQHLPFHRIAVPDMVLRLRAVAEAEGIEVEEEALRELARQADGALRDALSLMEQALAAGEGRIGVGAVRSLLGGASRADLLDWLSLLGEDPGAALRRLEELVARGASLERILEGLGLLFRDLWATLRFGGTAAEALGAGEAEIPLLRDQAAGWPEAALSGGMEACLALVPRVRAGLRADVFVGLLFRRLLSLREGTARPERLPEGAEAAGRRPSSPDVREIPQRDGERGEASYPPVGRAPIPRVPRSASPGPEPLPVPPSSPDAAEPGSSPSGTVPVERGRAKGPSRLPAILTFLMEEDLSVAAAFLRATVVDEGDRLRVLFPEEARFEAGLCGNGRARTLIAEGLKGLAPEARGPVLFGLEEQEEADGEGGNRAAPDPDPPGEGGEGPAGPFRRSGGGPGREGAGDPEEKSLPRPNPSSRPEGGAAEGEAAGRRSPGEEVTEKGEGLRDLLSWIDAEVLLVKGEETPSEPTGEEGAE